jgi:hypothetical protein
MPKTALDDLFLTVGVNKPGGHKGQLKFGYNPMINSGIEEDVSVIGGTYLFLSDTGEEIQIVSDNAGDTSEILVVGLDSEFRDQTKTVVLNGLTPVAIDGLWARINTSLNVSSVETLGTVDITDVSTGTKVVARILSGDQQTNQMIYTVPSGKRAFLKFIGASINGSAASVSNAIFKIKVRLPGGVFRTSTRFGLQKTGTSTIVTENIIPSPFPEKADVKLTALVDANSTDVSGLFELILVDNSVFGE